MFEPKHVEAGKRITINSKDCLILTSEDEKLYGLLEYETGKILFDIRFTAKELTEQINLHRHYTIKDLIVKKMDRIHGRGYSETGMIRRDLMTEILRVIAEGHGNPKEIAQFYFKYELTAKENARKARDSR